LVVHDDLEVKELARTEVPEEIDHAGTRRSTGASPATFILAPTPRSGTNFLWELLRRHPDATITHAPIWEDNVLKQADHLSRFVATLQGSWDPSWGPTDHLRSVLLRTIGDSVLAFLSRDRTKHLVTKTPSAENLHLLPDLFPSARAIVLVRDGRDVVASGMKTFGWSLEGGAAFWASSVEEMLDIVDGAKEEAVALVRYEDLATHTRATLHRILDFVRLNPAHYQMHALDEIPVRGSSQYLGDGCSEVNWDPHPRPTHFNAIGRWRHWSVDAVVRFEAIAGPQLLRAGYDLAAQS
jgi:protein-tyrosine sulfotransferase